MSGEGKHDQLSSAEACISDAIALFEPSMPDAQFNELKTALIILSRAATNEQNMRVKCEAHAASRDTALQNLGAAKANLEVSLTDQRSITDQLHREQITTLDMQLRLAFAEGFIASQPEAHAVYLKSRGQNLMTKPSLNDYEKWGIR